MRTIPTLALLFALALAGCTIKIFNGGGGGGDDDSHPSRPDAGGRGSDDGFDAGIYTPDAGPYDGGCTQPTDAGYYRSDAGCPGGFGSGGSGDCID